MIRAARLDDAEKIANLFLRSMPAPWSVSSVKDAIHSPSTVTWLWEENDSILGALILQVCLDEAEILVIATATEARRRGIGRNLISYALKELGRSLSVFLEVRSQNLSAIAFYKALGFSVYGMRKGYYREPPDDALLMKFRNF